MQGKAQMCCFFCETWNWILLLSISTFIARTATRAPQIISPWTRCSW